jgi:hypothetical protein
MPSWLAGAWITVIYLLAGAGWVLLSRELVKEMFPKVMKPDYWATVVIWPITCYLELLVVFPQYTLPASLGIMALYTLRVSIKRTPVRLSARKDKYDIEAQEEVDRIAPEGME